MLRMNNDEFTTLALSKRSDDLKREAVLIAAGRLAESKRTTGLWDTDVSECLALARSIQGADLVKVSSREFPVTPGTRKASEQLREQLAPWAERVRRDVFGADAAPFKTWLKAIDWLESQGVEERRNYPRTNPYELTLLEYAKSGARPRKGEKSDPVWAQQLYIGEGSTSQLARLKTEIAPVAEASGVREASLLGYILWPNASPIVHAVETTMRRSARTAGGITFERTEAVITLHVRDVTFAQLRRVYGNVRKEWNAPHDRGLSKRVGELLKVVRRVKAQRAAARKAGRYPTERLWEQVAPLAHYKTASAARLAHIRALRKTQTKHEKD